MQKFQNMEHSNSRTFQGLSRAWNFFQNWRTSKDFSRTPWTLFKDFSFTLKYLLQTYCQNILPHHI